MDAVRTLLGNKGSRQKADAAVADLNKQFGKVAFEVEEDTANGRCQVWLIGRPGQDGLEQGDVDVMRHITQDAQPSQDRIVPKE